MPRPKKRRWINSYPGADYFKPRGIPLSELEISQLGIDEYEAMRLYDIEGLDQAQAADMMNISRPTFGRIIAAAHKKVAEALVYGRAIRIGGGDFHCPASRGFGSGREGGRGGCGGGISGWTRLGSGNVFRSRGGGVLSVFGRGRLPAGAGRDFLEQRARGLRDELEAIRQRLGEIEKADQSPTE